MFEIGWSELLILGIVTLIFVGPKELPALMRTLGRYAGAMRRQANEFKAQFEESMREIELEDMRKEMEAMQASVNAEIMAASDTVKESKTAIEAAVSAQGGEKKASPDALDAGADAAGGTAAAAVAATDEKSSDATRNTAPTGKAE